MSNPSTRAPMTALEGFKLLAEEVLPKLIKRIAALEQGGAAQVDTSAILADVQARCQTLVDEAREHLLVQFDDQHKRLEALEASFAKLIESRVASKKRAARKKKGLPEEPVQEAQPVQEEPPVVLEDEPKEEQPEPVDQEAIARQVKAIAGVGLPLEDIAAKFGMDLETVKGIVDADHTA